MTNEDYVGVLSPNLGCPQILSLPGIEARKESAGGEGVDFTAIFAAGPRSAEKVNAQFFKGNLLLEVSYPTATGRHVVPLVLVGDPVEISQWNKIAPFQTIDEWRTLIPDELHYKVLGEGTRYWRVRLALAYSRQDDLLEPSEPRRLFDLVWRGSDGGRQVNYHSVQIVRDLSRCRFYQLSDVHTARRNDEMLEEILQDGAGQEVRALYVNFNQHLRKAIYYINKAAASGQLDFVLLSGDLVDFANHNWSYDVVPDDNNWTSFFDMATGRGRESETPVGVVDDNGTPVIGNPGFQVAVFTSTGNHDWRMYPYNPKGQHDIFGLTREQLQSYRYQPFDPAEYPNDPRAREAKVLRNRVLSKVNLDGLTQGLFKLAVSAAKIDAGTMVNPTFARYLWYAVAAVMGASPLLRREFSTAGSSLVLSIVALLILSFRIALNWLIRRGVNLVVDNPLDAGPKALHFYLRHINPYFDYVFSYGQNYFVVVDSGADVNNGQILDPRSLDKIKSMSLEDNVFGHSPDSLAFDARKLYYSWSQIVWLESVLESIWQEKGAKCVILVVHAPPINLGKEVKRASIFEEDHLKRRGHAWISDADYILTYGTINDYLSEFFYLCLGLKEYEWRLARRWNWWQNWRYRFRNWLSRHGMWSDPYRQRQELEEKWRQLLPSEKGSLPVDLVLCGHTHRLMEFRLWLDTNYEILIYSDFYSREYASVRSNERREWWQKRRPVIVQTPAGGPNSETDLGAPHFRRVVIENGLITDFSVGSWQTTERPVILTPQDTLIPA